MGVPLNAECNQQQRPKKKFWLKAQAKHEQIINPLKPDIGDIWLVNQSWLLFDHNFEH